MRTKILKIRAKEEQRKEWEIQVRNKRKPWVEVFKYLKSRRWKKE